jgi:hypothetical protein
LTNNGGEGHYIRFNSKREKKAFTTYSRKCYENYINFITTSDIIEKEKYKNHYRWYGDDELNILFDNNTNNNRQMELCLFYDATEYPEGNFHEYEIDSKNHWLIRIGHGGGKMGSNFKNSSKFNTWGVKRSSAVKGFEFLVKKGDILWFIPGDTNGYVLACAEYVDHKEIDEANMEKRYAELGWNINDSSSGWDVEIQYKNLTYTNKTETIVETIEAKTKYCTCIKGNSVNVRRYDRDNKEKCKIDLPRIYSDIVDNRSG